MNKHSKSETSEGRVATESSQTSSHRPAEVDPSIQGLLGKKLRESYEALVAEEVPSKFHDLLADLKKKEASSKDGT